MLNFKYDKHCAYKPDELGLNIAQLIMNGKIDPAMKFLYFRDAVVKEGDQILDDKHLCTVMMLDDKDNSEKDLCTMSNVASMLCTNENIQKDCKEDEGISLLVDSSIDNYKLKGDDADKRLVFMRLGVEEFKKFQEDSKKTMANCDIFAYDKVQKCYYCVFNMNKNSIKQASDNKIDLVKCSQEMNFEYATRFVQKHWPEECNDFKLNHIMLDTQREFYDEEDKVFRRTWKYVFRILKKDGSHIEGDHAVKMIDAPAIDGNSTYKDVSEVLKYYVSAGILRDDDSVLMVSASNRSILYIKSEEDISEDVKKLLKYRETATVKDVIESFESNKGKIGEVEFIDNVLEFVKENKDALFGKISNLSLIPGDIFDEK